MAVQFDTASRNHLADQWEVHVGTSPVIRFFDGAIPAATGDANVGTELVAFSLPSDWLSAASGGAKGKAGAWPTPNADAAGTARYFRLFNSGGTCKQQGLISDPWAASRVYAAGHHVHNGGNLYRCTTGGTSAGSGGPTGTGGSITDGTVTWTWVQAGTDLTISNCALNAGQQVEIASYSFTVGGA